MFLVNSRLGLFTAAGSTFGSICLSSIRHPFSRSYGVILPSSLTKILPLVLGFSPRLPVSVCGTGSKLLNRDFSWQCGVSYFSTCFSIPITPWNMKRWIFLSASPYMFGRTPTVRLTYPPASSHLSNAIY